MTMIMIDTEVLEQTLAALVRSEVMHGQPNFDIQDKLREALAQPQPVQEPVAWSERIKELADQYAIECVEFSKGIPNGAHSMSPIAVKAGDTRLALHSAIDTGERFIRAIESATLAAQVERATQPQPVQEPVAEVVMTTKPQKASPAWLPFKTVYAPISWLDRAPIGTKLYTSPQAQPLSDDKLEQIEAVVKELTETLEDLADYAGAFSVSGVYLIEDKHARALLAQAYKLVLKHDN